MVPLDAEIMIEFSERVVRSSVEDAIFLSPGPEGKLELSWKGRRVKIRVPGGLQPNRTYVLTIGAGARDLRNNVMRESFTLAFSTGSKIDRCQIAGRVFQNGRPVPGVLVSAYDLAVLPEPDPGRHRAMYFTQSGTDGGFRLEHLKASQYRVFVWQDRDANRLWNAGEEAIGVPWRDVSAREDSAAPTLLFWLAALDSSGPTLVDARSQDRRHLVLRTSERVDSLRSHLQFGLVGTLETGVVFYRDDLFADRLKLAATFDLPSRLSVWVRGLADRWGNRTGSDTIEVEVADTPDTSAPRIVHSVPEDSARNVLPMAPIDIWFSEALDTAQAADAVKLVDESGDSLGFQLRWVTPAHLRLVPKAPLAGLREYRVALQGLGLRDLSGNAAADSTLLLRFWTANPDTLTEIRGRIGDAKPDAVGPIRVLAIRAEDAAIVASTTLPDTGFYRLQDLFPGQYLLMAYRDADGDGQLSPGWPQPFRPSERFVVYADTVQARSRWINEGNDFELPW